LLLLGRAVEKGVVCGDALAAVAVTGAAFAQANITGTLDVAAISNGKVATTAANGNATTTVKTNSTSGVAGSWATSELRFGGSEDLGGGLTASFQVNSDLRNAGVFASRDRWLQLSGGFGSLRLGNQGNVGNSAGFFGYTQTGTTGVGSTYGLGVAGGIERQTNVINYTSPNFNGVSVMVGTARNSSDSDATTRTGKASTTQNGLSVTYASGPLRAGFGTTQRTTNVEAAPRANATLNGEDPAIVITSVGSVAVAASETKVKANFIGASYDLGVATVGGSIINNDSKTGGAATRDQKLNVIGVTVPMGAITLRASTYTGKDSATPAATSNIKHSGHQISATYALSKRTTVYAYMGENKTKRDGAASTAEVTKATGTHIGLAHNF
jgi:GBP family porin